MFFEMIPLSLSFFRRQLAVGDAMLEAGFQ